MGRKDLTHIRREEILDAFEQCIFRYGFDGATLQRTAEEARVNLGTIHHYIGKREDLLKLLLDRLLERTTLEAAQLKEHQPQEEQLHLLLEAFFLDPQDPTSRMLTLLVQEGSSHPQIRAFLTEINTLYCTLLSEAIQTHRPGMKKSPSEQLAFTILALAYGGDILMDFGLPRSKRDRLMDMAKFLIDTSPLEGL
ncbi:TetR/AcrR family transcriptional regulator [Deinococcus cellulosilyticus]|uniref:HTH tetR-type domain-containing protein n=1 Tax=Deinococcus cellulosilyticus (strain DSM 18568 / NBRC 106333 / KACC 11606 / 5516J-15) TaxID=1223518 RepID=A0A511MWU5_DEIC1|nr:TetR/AcrR family transcriptional regulator [Deinococcus cellulosilyticus]GEM45042.1 hypothetical protein DC3_06770 [Deinococcus cellulosilyticus NBRC 106333 = KACC 11606]